MVYVDDCAIAYDKQSQPLFDTFCVDLAKDFKYTNRGDLQWFLGFQVTRDRKAGTLKIDQGSFVRNMLAEYNMLDCVPVSTPGVPGTHPGEKFMPGTGAEYDSEKAAMKLYPYRRVVGSLLWLARCTRPDLAFTAGILSRALHNPGYVHKHAAKHALRYCKLTADHGLTFRRSATSTLTGQVDSDWQPDYGTSESNRRSTTGWVFWSCGSAVSWRSSRQKAVAASSAEAEYMAAFCAARECVFLRRLKADLGCPQLPPTVIGEDNQACIRISKNPCDAERTKHIDGKYHLVRDLVKDNVLELQYIDTNNMCADMLTKFVPLPKVNKFRSGILGSCSSNSSRLDTG